MDSEHSSRARLHFEGGGRVAYTAPGQRYATGIHVSYKPGPGRWVVDVVHFAGFRVTARDLRDLPLGQIEAWVNQLAQQGLHDAIDAELSEPMGFAVSGDAVMVDKLPPTPATGAKGDEFYRRVAEIYSKAALVSTRPAAELAEAWGVPVTTVHGWVKRARLRGYLPPGESGRRG
jgi:hypothetical protein